MTNNRLKTGSEAAPPAPRFVVLTTDTYPFAPVAVNVSMICTVRDCGNTTSILHFPNGYPITVRGNVLDVAEALVGREPKPLQEKRTAPSRQKKARKQ